MILTFIAVPIRSVLLYHTSAKFNFSLTVFLLHFYSRKAILNRHYRIFRRALWTFWFILSIHLFVSEAFHFILTILDVIAIPINVVFFYLFFGEKPCNHHPKYQIYLYYQLNDFSSFYLVDRYFF